MKNIMRNNDKNEKGFASLIISMILIVILALVTLGFAENARKNEQAALDKSLANQAYYAAESGVNELQAQLPKMVSTVPAIKNNTCLSSPWVQKTNSGTNSGAIDPTNNVTITCASVNLNPTADIGNSNQVPGSNNFIFSTTSGLPGNTITFAWGSKDNHNAPAPITSPLQLPDLGTWSTGGTPPGLPPVVQLSITPLSSLSRKDMISNTFTIFAYPGNSAGSPVNYPGPNPDGYSGAGCTIPSGSPQIACDDSANNDPIVQAKYTAKDPNNPGQPNSYPYSVTINNLPADTGGTSGSDNWWLVHWVNFYDGAVACLEGQVSYDCNSNVASGGGTPVTFNNSQADIDVTGKAKNVVKRIFAIVPISGKSSTQQGADSLPGFAINSNNSCKLFDIYPTLPVPSSNAVFHKGQSKSCDLEK
ncbi:MAG: hypothetical protein ACHQT9_01465 [Candidatus Saccharimonadales bacterium]